MGSTISKTLGPLLFPGGAGHGEDDDLSHEYSSFYDLSAKDADGNVVEFSKFKGKVILIINSARK